MEGSALGEEEHMLLGGSIELSGFRNVESQVMVVLKKMVGKYARKLSETRSGFERLNVRMKKVHEQEHSEKYEIHTSVIERGRLYAATATDRNLFFALGGTLSSVEHQLSKSK